MKAFMSDINSRTHVGNYADSDQISSASASHQSCSSNFTYFPLHMDIVRTRNGSDFGKISSNVLIAA